MQIETLKVSELKPAPYNPRQISEIELTGLSESIKKFGYIQPIIVNKRNNTIVGGHQRLKALESQGIEEVECIIVDFDPITEKAANISLNNSAVTGTFDYDLLNPLLDELKLDFDAFEAVRLDELLIDMPETFEPSENDDFVPEIEDDPIIKKGDLIELGEHRLICGDSTDPSTVERLLDGSKIDMVFTDPPYGVSYASKNDFLNQYDKGNCNQTEIEADHSSIEDVCGLWKEVFSNIKDNFSDYSSYYICSPPGKDMVEFINTLNRIEVPVKHILIWSKNNHVLGRSDYNYKHEPIFFGWSKKHKFYGNGEQKTSVWQYNKPLKNDLHPTMKPVELVSNAVMNSSQLGMNIFDAFLGSGSTLIACEKTNRKCFGIELSEHYCEVIIGRWCQFTGKDTIRINGEECQWSSIKG